MGDLFRKEIFQSVVTLLVPGIVLLCPFAIKLMLTYPWLLEFATSNPGASVIISGVFSIAVGLILEDLGAWLETKWDARLNKDKESWIRRLFGDWVEIKWDKYFDKGKAKRTQGEHIKIWKRYLQLTFQSEPEGQVYLLSILLRMKFELSMVFAVPVSWLGFLWLHLNQMYACNGTVFLWSGRAFGFGSLLAFGLTCYLIKESFDSADTMARTRKLLVKKYEPRESPKPRIII